MIQADERLKVAVLHGAGYAGSELVTLLLRHPSVSLQTVTSRAFAGNPIWKAHVHLRGQTDLLFAPDDSDVSSSDVVFITAEHGMGAAAVKTLLDASYKGIIIDLSADFRFVDAAIYPEWFGFDHPAPERLGAFVYGLPEVRAPYPAGTRFVANPGCFATGLALSLWPVALRAPGFHAFVTALTGASGSGTRPKETTHFPTRDGNVRAYKVLSHQHLPEVRQLIGDRGRIDFVPVSGPWTRGIWGTAHLQLPVPPTEEAVRSWFEDAYRNAPFLRLTPGELPEMRASVGTPFCDIGWVVKDDALVVGFALDNLLKGAAAQAVQNMNLVAGLPETAGLLPASAPFLELA